MANRSETVLEIVAASGNNPGLAEVIDRDFDRARRSAFWRRLKAFLRGERNDLAWLPALRESVGSMTEEYRGFETIDVDRIVGSESRAAEFDRDFLPRSKHLDHRWSRVNAAFRDNVILPPIQVFEFESQYYVRDGNHRVSVAKFCGVRSIRAEVVRLHAVR